MCCVDSVLRSQTQPATSLCGEVWSPVLCTHAHPRSVVIILFSPASFLCFCCSDHLDEFLCHSNDRLSLSPSFTITKEREKERQEEKDQTRKLKRNHSHHLNIVVLEGSGSQVGLRIIIRYRFPLPAFIVSSNPIQYGIN